jgi:hypothetical protein
LEQAGVRRWEELAALRDAQLRSLAAAGTASEARLRRLRGQAQLVVEVGLAPADAALLLHAGIPSRQALAEADPQRLLLQVGRLQRTLAGDSLPPIDRALVRDWIRRARRASGRSAN